jgi:[acyl-carrier-protein] S-malonyltransferase
MKTAFFFPGQGSQKVGMVHDLYEKYDSVKKIIREADDTLGFSISKMMFEGPDTELMKTEFTQPAILTASVCCWQVLKEEGVIPRNRIGSEYHYSAEYMKFITQWYDAIIPQIKDFDNIIQTIFTTFVAIKDQMLCE